MGRIRNQWERCVRPVVIGPGGALINLEVYDGSSGGTNINGWSKVKYRKSLTPPAPPMDITAVIGNRKWELGVNIMLWGWHWEVNWFSGGVTSYEWPVTSTGTSTTTLTLRAMAPDESILGTISTTTWTANDSLNTSISGFVPTFNFSCGYTVASGGSWAGSMNAIELERTWTGTVNTSRTTIGDPIFIDDIFYSTFGPVIK